MKILAGDGRGTDGGECFHAGGIDADGKAGWFKFEIERLGSGYCFVSVLTRWIGGESSFVFFSRIYSLLLRAWRG